MQKFKIENFNCMSCFHNIQDALKEFDEKIEVSSELKDKIVIVDSDHSSKDLIAVIAEAGYRAKEI